MCGWWDPPVTGTSCSATSPCVTPVSHRPLTLPTKGSLLSPPIHVPLPVFLRHLPVRYEGEPARLGQTGVGTVRAPDVAECGTWAFDFSLCRAGEVKLSPSAGIRPKESETLFKQAQGIAWVSFNP